MSLADQIALSLQSRWYSRRRAPLVLLPLSALFGIVAGARRLLYRCGLLRRVRLPVRVVVVGNIAVGGSGKTPLVAWLARELATSGVRVAVVTRGYGGHAAGVQRVTAQSAASDCGDEALWLARTTGVPVMAGRDRIAAVRALLVEDAPTLVLSDDGLQHYRLARDIEIVAVDAQRGFGNGALLPAGPLRERPARLGEAAAVVLKGDGQLEIPPGPRVFRMRWSLGEAVRLSDSQTAPLAAFTGAAVRALAAIADPESFFLALEREGLIVERHPARDHADIARMIAALPTDRPLMVTDKDAVKLAAGPAHLWRVPLEVAFASDDARALLEMVRGRVASSQ